MAGQLAKHVDAMAAKYGVPVSHARAIFEIESSSGKNKAVSKAGARGPMQLMPATAKELGVNIDNPLENIEGGVKYYGKLLKRFGDPILAVAAYNAGPGNVRKAGGVPRFKETQDYVRKFTGMVGGENLMEKPKQYTGRSAKPGAPVTIDLMPPKPYDPNFDVEGETESNFASLLAKIGVGSKKKRSTKKKLPGILDGIL